MGRGRVSNTQKIFCKKISQSKKRKEKGKKSYFNFLDTATGLCLKEGKKTHPYKIFNRFSSKKEWKKKLIKLKSQGVSFYLEVEGVASIADRYYRNFREGFKRK